MNAILSGGVVLPPSAVVDLDLFRLHNPKWRQWKMLVARGRRPTEPPRYLDAWRGLPGPHPWEDAIVLPRHAPQAGLRLVDRTSAPSASSIDISVELRPYQEAALAAWEAAGRQGVVVAPCGAGKTTLGLGAIARTPTPALVLVHTLDLARQWVDRAAEQLGIDATLVGGGNDQAPGRLTVATLQTLATWDWWERVAWGKAFGLLIVDECHHTPAETFANVIFTMAARHRLGLSATPKRSDGLTDLLWWHLGSVAANIDQRELVQTGVVMAPDVRQVETGWEPPCGEWVQMLTAASVSQERNHVVLDQVSQLLREGRQVLVLTERMAHAEGLAHDLCEDGVAAAALTGARSKKDRAAVLDAAGEQELQVVCATTVADEGLDLPRLDALLLALPVKQGGRLQQRVGRVMRQAAGKRQPVVVDLVDDSDASRRLAGQRMAFYKKMGICA